ncbi:RagB/SusD family nutrient uptake outer membrane protein [Flammeovirga sp. EKP202]|uniref:RagB/SusD family nutrient uptake outer membrane protein n=1 Tax=Flammeovirga sp. EKP202 TaxID=2770592 RepID=UPI00165F041F|nr:RagB/SusD family nutrient uptake outer membrane protein [Flammeovirga sp. EKP202]MBD0401733.1 RagB/SusD family nutrient uptake outer membrane protein [Flammeovirga sp. EKP202]
MNLFKGYRKAVLSAILLGSTTFSCVQLEDDTVGTLSADNFYNNEADVQKAVLATYAPLGDRVFSNSERYTHLWGGDDRTAVTGSNKALFLEYDQFDPSSTNWMQNSTWKTFWQIVSAANAVLDNEDKIRNNIPQEEVANRLIAEARYNRALAYFELVRGWGRIPLLKSNNGITGAESRSEFPEIYDLIISDLEFAKDKLPSDRPADGIYRATTWTAHALLANVYLTSAGFPLKNTANYAKAAEAAKYVMDNGGFAIDSYENINSRPENNLMAQGNTEVIIAFPADDALGWNNGNFNGPAIDWEDKNVEWAFFESFPEGARKENTFDYDPAEPDVRPKYGRDNKKFGETWFLKGDIHYLRYAELLLIYAEAQIMATGNTSDQSAINALNEVKTRAGVPTVASATQEDVFWERGWETAGEWSRWHDMVRLQLIEEVHALRDPRDNELTPLLGVIDEENPFAPIPADDVNLNPNLGDE